MQIRIYVISDRKATATGAGAECSGNLQLGTCPG